MRVSGFGFRRSGSRVSGLGFRVKVPGDRPENVGGRRPLLGYGLGFEVGGSSFGVLGFEVGCSCFSGFGV